MTPIRQHFEFLKEVWNLFLGRVSAPFEKHLIYGWVSEQVYERLDVETSVQEASGECKTEQDIEESFNSTVSRLNRDWDKILPSYRHHTIKLINTFGLREHFNVPFELTESELEEVSIRWDIADMLFAEAKRQTLEECRNLGFDLENRTINWQIDSSAPSMQVIVNRWTDLFFDLLRTKMDFDLSVIKIVQPSARYHRYKTRAKQRCNDEFLQILVKVREFLFEDAMTRTHPDDVPTAGRIEEVCRWNEYLLDPFKTKFKQFFSQADHPEPNPVVYERVRGLVRRDTKPMPKEVKVVVKEVAMGDIYKNLGQAGAMGRNAHAHDINFVQLWQQTSEQIDLLALASELSKLRETLVQEARKPEDYAAVGMIASAEIEAKNKNGPQALEYLSKAGKWTLDVATKIGVVVAASAIKTALGMP